MPQRLKTRHPLLRECEARGLRQIAQYRFCAHIDRLKSIGFYRRLTRSAVADVRAVRRTQAELG